MDNVQIQDEIGKDIIAEQIKALEREIKGFEENKQSLIDAKANYIPQWDIDKEIYEIMIEGHKKIEPTHYFEQNDRYWELRRKQLEYKYRSDKFTAESRIKGYDTQLQMIEEEIASAKKKLAEIQVKGE